MIKYKIILIMFIFLILISTHSTAVTVQLTSSSGRKPINIITEHSEKNVGVWIKFDSLVRNFSFEFLENNLSINSNDSLGDTIGVDLSLPLETLEDLPFGNYSLPLRIIFDRNNDSFDGTFFLNFTYCKDFLVTVNKKAKNIGNNWQEVQIIVESFIELRDFNIELDSDGELKTEPKVFSENKLVPGKHFFNYSIKINEENSYLSIDKDHTYFEVKIECQLSDGRYISYLSEQHIFKLEKGNNNPLTPSFWTNEKINIVLIIILISLIVILILNYLMRKKNYKSKKKK